MSGKDFITLLLCSYGYVRNIEVRTYRGDCNAIGYDISAQNYKGDWYTDENCEGLMYNISAIISHMQENNVPLFNSEFNRFDLKVKDFLDEKTRNKLIKRNDEDQYPLH
jgi:hypothetical protein